MADANVFLTNDLFQKFILPFVLIFALFFAILEKSKLLGEEKRQINAIISFVIAALFVSFSTYVDWTSKFIIFLVIAIVILFVFMLIYGFIYSTKDGNPLQFDKWVKPTLGAVAMIAVIIATLKITGYWQTIQDSANFGTNILFLIFIVAAIIAVVASGDKKGGSSS